MLGWLNLYLDYKTALGCAKSSYPSGGYIQTDTKFDFIGNPLYIKTEHKKDASALVLTTKDAFTYTDQSRPLKHTHKVNNRPEQLISLNQYDALGQLKSKKVGGTDVSGAVTLQVVDFKYNIRGWLTDINNVNNLNQPGGGPTDLFAFKLDYTDVNDNINGAVQPLYNGNIAQATWRTSSDNIKRRYGYSYDKQNRLLAAYYQLPGTTIPRADSYSTEYSYDINGNILSLTRNGDFDESNPVTVIDSLKYAYDVGNLLKSVRDYERNPSGYYDRHTNANVDDFEYDDYGNLTINRDKDIIGIQYNHLNLPTKITFGSGGKIEYFYPESSGPLE